VRRFLALLVVLAFAATAAPGSARVPRDPSWPFDWAQQRVRMPEVWEHTTGHPDVVIASVDTGVNTALVDLGGAIVPGWDFVDGDATTEDLHGHGTLVATEMVARGDNAVDIAGYCWQCRLMPVRVGSSQETDDRLIAQGIRWAVDQGARVINVGFVHETGPAPDGTVGAAVAYALARGALVVASAGNTGNSAPTYPGAYPGVLAVAATDEQDRLHSWSTRGDWVALAAPGCQAVISMLGPWGWLCGSSFTAPAVSAIAALAFSLNPNLTAAQLRAALISTAVPVPGIGGGRVDAFAALRALGAIPPPSPPSPPPAPPPPPASPKRPGKATQTTPRVARSYSGVLRARLRRPIEVGAGRLTVKLTSRSLRGCGLSVTSANEVLLPTQRRRDLLALADVVPAGRYVIDVRCSSGSPKRYRLSIAGAPRAGDSGGTSRG
jgi:subtilisin family serine protease